MIIFGFGIYPSWYWSILLLIPLLVDWGLQEKFKIMSNNARRLVTGVLGGAGVGFAIWGVVLKGIDLLIAVQPRI